MKSVPIYVRIEAYNIALKRALIRAAKESITCQLLLLLMIGTVVCEFLK